MTASSPRPDRRPALVLAACLLAGCSFLAPRPDPSQFYILTPAVEAGASGDAATSAQSFGLGPVRVPDYLKRPTIVTRTSETQITPSTTDRWGEPLDKAVALVLQEDLRRLLGTDRVVLFPWYPSDRPDLQATVELLRFERDADGRVTLVARWEIRRPAGSILLRTGETRTVRDAADSSAGASVAAQSAALAVLAQDIAAALRAAPAP